jgi:hypothetical protein
MGFANVRLGRWWPHGIAREKAQPRGLFASQRYLFDELTATFQVSRLPYAYLSDGGHFENTAAYEMLRPERKVQLLVLCDCGADPEYLFGDLANLVRLARIDYQLELRVNTDVLTHPELKKYFAKPESFRRDADGNFPPPSERCAVLLDVMGHEQPCNDTTEAMKVLARIIMLKQALVPGVPIDVSNYAAEQESFPQEPTGDQFFDEAQWESYRKLGLQVATQLFPQQGQDRYMKDFWETILI